MSSPTHDQNLGYFATIFTIVAVLWGNTVTLSELPKWLPRNSQWGKLDSLINLAKNGHKIECNLLIALLRDRNSGPNCSAKLRTISLRWHRKALSQLFDSSIP